MAVEGEAGRPGVLGGSAVPAPAGRQGGCGRSAGRPMRPARWTVAVPCNACRPQASASTCSPSRGFWPASCATPTRRWAPCQTIVRRGPTRSGRMRGAARDPLHGDRLECPAPAVHWCAGTASHHRDRPHHRQRRRARQHPAPAPHRNHLPPRRRPHPAPGRPRHRQRPPPAPGKGETMRWQPITRTLACRLADHAQIRGAILPTSNCSDTATAGRSPASRSCRCIGAAHPRTWSEQGSRPNGGSAERLSSPAPSNGSALPIGRCGDRARHGTIG